MAVTRDEVMSKLKEVMHPAINLNLPDLGIVQDASVEGDTIFVTLAFPAPNIPIRDMLINSVREPLKALGKEIEIEVTTMTPTQLQNFLSLEKANWKGL